MGIDLGEGYRKVRMAQWHFLQKENPEVAE